MVGTLQNHSGIHNSTAGLTAAKLRHTLSLLSSKAPLPMPHAAQQGAVRRPHRLGFGSESGRTKA